jgi:CubicO group peptidase (beta-lactamase class C family)
MRYRAPISAAAALALWFTATGLARNQIRSADMPGDVLAMRDGGFVTPHPGSDGRHAPPVGARMNGGPGPLAGVAERGGGASCELPVSEAPGEGIDPAALDSLVRVAERTRSDALVVLRDGELVGEWYFGTERGPIQTMSVTKSVVSMAIGHLLDAGAITSLDQPVADFYPEWRQGRKRDVTIRHLLNHTSGLHDVPSAGEEIYPAPDAVQLALAAELTDAPGTAIAYNNNATNLLAGVVRRAAGIPLDEYVQRRLLDPLCIPEQSWYRDTAGNPHGMAGLELEARDLARLGQLMLDGGRWNGTPLLSEAWVEESTRVSQPFSPRVGLLWWRLPEWSRVEIDSALVGEWEAAGVDPSFIERVQPLVGRAFEPAAFTAALNSLFGEGAGREAWREATFARGVVGQRIHSGPLRAFSANGYLGQHLVVLPSERLVVVRQKRASPDHTDAHDLTELPELLVSLFGVP